MAAEHSSSEQGSTSRACMKPFAGMWSFTPVSPQIKSLCFVGFHLTFWCDLQRRKHLGCQLEVSAAALHLQRRLDRADLLASFMKSWRNRFYPSAFRPLNQKNWKINPLLQRSIYFLLCRYLHTDWRLIWVSYRKGCCLHLFFAFWPVWQGVPTMIYCILVTCGEDRFPTCTVEALLSCRAVILNPADLFNQEHWSRSRGQEVRIHRLSGPLLSFSLAQFTLVSHCWPNTATLS